MKNYSISVNNLSVTYKTVSILEDLNFQIEDGEFIGIIGKSGEGKTTLLNAIAGFIKHTGNVTTEGKIGFCFQSNSLFNWMTVEDNIAFGLNGMRKEEKDKIVIDVLKKIGLEQYGKFYPTQLSGGQVQRVALGRAIAYKPSIILLDEPFSSLDIFTRDQMIDWVLKLISEMKVTVVMVTHYVDEALIFSDRILLVKNKNIAQDIEINFPKPRTQSIRFTEDFQNKKQQLFEYLNS
jgi:iron(III) transport system ATP-binding protein